MNDLYEVFDKRFGECTVGDQQLERLHTGSRWAEGPCYLPAMRCLLWSDIPNDRLLRWDETNEVVSVFRSPAGHVNGNTLDRQGRLVSCEQGNRRVTRTEHDGSMTVLADHFKGQRLNSPNDAAVSCDGTVWFTDPDFGIASDYEGHRAESEIGACNVYRIDPSEGAVTLAATGLKGPNGVILAEDESELLVCDSRTNQVHAFTIAADGHTTGESRVIAQSEKGSFDNIRLDDHSRLWVGAGEEGVHCYHPDGTLLGLIRVPELVSNIQFGGPKRNRMFITATSSLYSLMLSTTGAPVTRNPYRP